MPRRKWIKTVSIWTAASFKNFVTPGKCADTGFKVAIKTNIHFHTWISSSFSEIDAGPVLFGHPVRTRMLSLLLSRSRLSHFMLLSSCLWTSSWAEIEENYTRLEGKTRRAQEKKQQLPKVSTRTIRRCSESELFHAELRWHRWPSDDVCVFWCTCVFVF